MTNEERDLISQFVARVGGNAAGGFSRSVPSTQSSLPPIDPEADRFIGEQFATHPEARYRVTQMAVVQEAALAEAASRMQRMQAELDSLRQQMQQAPQQGQSRGFLGGLFGGGQSAPSPQQQQSPWNQGRPNQPQYAPQAAYAPQYPPNVQPGTFQNSGSGFLGSALKTAAGVAGGVVAGNLLMDMFSGHGGGLGGGFGGGGFGGAGMPGDTTIINNYGDQGGGYPDAGGASAGWDNSTQGGGDQGWTDNSQDSGGGWDGGAQDSGGGFDDNSL